MGVMSRMGLCRWKGVVDADDGGVVVKKVGKKRERGEDRARWAKKASIFLGRAKARRFEEKIAVVRLGYGRVGRERWWLIEKRRGVVAMIKGIWEISGGVG